MMPILHEPPLFCSHAVQIGLSACTRRRGDLSGGLKGMVPNLLHSLISNIKSGSRRGSESASASNLLLKFSYFFFTPSVSKNQKDMFHEHSKPAGEHPIQCDVDILLSNNKYQSNHSISPLVSAQNGFTAVSLSKLFSPSIFPILWKCPSLTSPHLPSSPLSRQRKAMAPGWLQQEGQWWGREKEWKGRATRRLMETRRGKGRAGWNEIRIGKCVSVTTYLRVDIVITNTLVIGFLKTTTNESHQYCFPFLRVDC